MKRVKVLCLTMYILAVFFLQGCKVQEESANSHKNNVEMGDDERSYRMGLAVDQEFDSRVGVTDAIKKAAQANGVTILESIANGDQQTQNEQILEFIEEEVDAILVCAVDQIMIEEALESAEEAGIPVVAFDRDIPNIETVDGYVGPDSYADGMECGEALLRAFEDVEGRIYVLELVGALNDQNGIDRSAGFNDAVGKNEDIVVIQMPTDWDVDSATEAVLTAFQSVSNIQGVFCSTDSFMPSVNAVLKKLEKNYPVGDENHIFVNGVNGSKEGYEAVSQGVSDGFMVMNLDTVGIMSVETALSLIKGEKVQQKILVNSTYYTTENMDKNIDKIWGAGDR